MTSSLSICVLFAQIVLKENFGSTTFSHQRGSEGLCFHGRWGGREAGGGGSKSKVKEIKSDRIRLRRPGCSSTERLLFLRAWCLSVALCSRCSAGQNAQMVNRRLGVSSVKLLIKHVSRWSDSAPEMHRGRRYGLF